MKRNLSAAMLLVGSLVLTGQALADCPGPFLQDVKRRYENGQAAEKNGQQERALFAYAAAQGSICEGANPYEADAARRAATLGLALGTAAEKRGDMQRAFELYEAAGHYAHADRALMAVIRTKAHLPGAFQQARSHFQNREIESFRSNHAAALKAAGPYQLDRKYLDEVKAMPPKGVAVWQQKAAEAFNEQYLRDYVQLMQSRTDDLTDAAAIQRGISAQGSFVQKWQDRDFMKETREALSTLRTWGATSGDEQLEKRVQAQFLGLTEQHAQTLIRKYSGAPKLLEDAVDFLRMRSSDRAETDAQVAPVLALARKLGDEASAKKRYLLAADYYSAAGDSAKAQALREKQQQVAMQKMQPSIDAAKRQAEEMKKQFSDPAQVEAMKAQAAAAAQTLQQQQAASKEKNKKAADDLESELGL